jgi:NADPH:quinone reductase-like Zn-dependent oxidoreductase
MMSLINILIVFVFVVAISVYRILPSYGFDVDPAPADPRETMNAIIYASHGGSDVLQFKTIPRPNPSGKYVQIKVFAASLNPCDYKMRRNEVPSLVIPLPKTPGGDIAGIVDYAPPGSAYSVGDRVVAMVPLVGTRWGGYGEYYAAKESHIARIPDNISFEKAASLPLVALTTLKGLEDIENPSSKSILIHAGSGGVGTFAVQWAKNVLGMKTVAATCSDRNIQQVMELGADVVIDYRKHDFTKIIKNYDIVFDPMSYQYEQPSLIPGECLLVLFLCNMTFLFPMYALGVIAARGSYINIVSSDFQLSSGGSEVANDFWTFINPVLYALRRLVIDPDAISYKTVLVAPDGNRLAQVMEAVRDSQ